VDDIILAIPPSFFNHTLDTFNSFHPRIQFTMEIAEDNKINFLDVTLISDNNFLIFDWYHKDTFSGRYLHFLSQHSLCQKRGTIIGLIDKVFRLSHPVYHYKNIKMAINILLNNGYL